MNNGQPVTIDTMLKKITGHFLKKKNVTCKLNLYQYHMVQLIVVVLSCQYFLVTVNEEKNIYGQGSHSDWKTWKNGKAFSSKGKVREF